MTKKRAPKKEVPVEYMLLPPEASSPIQNLLDDSVLMKQLVDLASTGFSMSSIAAYASIPSSTFIRWVKQGKALEEEQPNLPEVILWKELSKGWATAKGLAEAKLSQVDPKYFLTHGPAKFLGNDWDEEASGTVTNAKETLDVTQDFVTALKRLRERGHDLNEIIDNNLMEVKVDRTEKPVDLLEKNGITNNVPVGLPGPFAKKTVELNELLNLETEPNVKKQ
jgi:hypothetical protein